MSKSPRGQNPLGPKSPRTKIPSRPKSPQDKIPSQSKCGQNTLGPAKTKKFLEKSAFASIGGQHHRCTLQFLRKYLDRLLKVTVLWYGEAFKQKLTSCNSLVFLFMLDLCRELPRPTAREVDEKGGMEEILIPLPLDP